MQRLKRNTVRCAIVLSLVGVLYLVSGCASSVDQATAEDVTNRAFTFTSGAVFHMALVNEPTTLIFLNNATAFMLLSADGSRSASGSNRFGSCILTVTASDFASGTGPQVNDVITLSLCDFDGENSTLRVTNGPTTVTSAPAVARVVEATANDVRSRSFIFANGAVFHPGLADLGVTLSFNSDATEFRLVSIDGTATGPMRFGPCVLNVTSSNYGPGNGPAVGTVLTLSTCRFNGGNRTLFVSNGTITAQSI